LWLPIVACCIELLGTSQQASAYHHSLTFRCSTVSTSTASSLQTNGPSRKVGKRLPGLKALVNNPTPLADSGDEGLVWSGDYPLHVTSATAYKTGMPAVPIRWVLIKDPKGSLNKRSMHGLDGHASSNLAMVSLSLAGSHFEEARAHLGLNLNVITGVIHPALLALFSIVTPWLISNFFSIRLSCQKQLGIRRHYRRLPMR